MAHDYTSHMNHSIFDDGRRLYDSAPRDVCNIISMRLDLHLCVG